MNPSNRSKPTLDPGLREKLLDESNKPFRGLRRALWIAFFGSACLGFMVMLSRPIGGDAIILNDFLIQTSAVILFGGLLWFDRGK